MIIIDFSVKLFSNNFQNEFHNFIMCPKIFDKIMNYITKKKNFITFGPWVYIWNLTWEFVLPYWQLLGLSRNTFWMLQWGGVWVESLLEHWEKVMSSWHSAFSTNDISIFHVSSKEPFKKREKIFCWWQKIKWPFWWKFKKIWKTNYMGQSPIKGKNCWKIHYFPKWTQKFHKQGKVSNTDQQLS